MSGGSNGFDRLIVVLSKALLVLVESHVFSFVVSVIFLLTRLVVGNIDILESTSLFLSKSLSNVVLNFLLVLTSSSVSVGSLKLDHLLELNLLKSESSLPLLKVFFEFFILVEGRGDKLLTPERNVRGARSSVDVVNITVINSKLVEPSQSEGPDIILFKTVINSGIIGIRRVSVERFALNIVEFECFIIIILGDRVADSYDVLVLWLVRLQTLKVINLVKGDIIHVFENVRVLHNVIIEAREGVLKNRAYSSSIHQLLHADVETSVELVVLVLVMLTSVVDVS